MFVVGLVVIVQNTAAAPARAVAVVFSFGCIFLLRVRLSCRRAPALPGPTQSTVREARCLLFVRLDGVTFLWCSRSAKKYMTKTRELRKSSSYVHSSRAWPGLAAGCLSEENRMFLEENPTWFLKRTAGSPHRSREAWTAYRGGRHSAA